MAQNVFGIDRAEGVLHTRPNGCLRLCGNLLSHDVVYHGGEQIRVHLPPDHPHPVDDLPYPLVSAPQILKLRLTIVEIHLSAPCLHPAVDRSSAPANSACAPLRNHRIVLVMPHSSLSPVFV